jgi:hypothetical protein
VTVLRLIRKPEIEQHRAALCQWLTDNGIDPTTVADRWLSIEHEADGQTVIRYPAYKLDPSGRRSIDPDNCNQAWTEQRTTPMTVELPPYQQQSEAPADGDASSETRAWHK